MYINAIVDIISNVENLTYENMDNINNSILYKHFD